MAILKILEIIATVLQFVISFIEENPDVIKKTPKNLDDGKI